MPFVTASDSLPPATRRVLVAGTSGSGKTTLAARIGESLGIPHVELDGLFHGPGWTVRPSFEDDVAALVAEPAWVTDGFYPSVRSILVARAELVVWLDLPRARVMWQVVSRTVRRRIRRTELWNGNVEADLLTFFTDPEHVVRWAWSTHSSTAERIAAALLERPELPVARLRSRREVERWIDGPLRAVAETAR